MSCRCCCCFRRRRHSVHKPMLWRKMKTSPAAFRFFGMGQKKTPKRHRQQQSTWKSFFSNHKKSFSLCHLRCSMWGVVWWWRERPTAFCFCCMYVCICLHVYTPRDDENVIFPDPNKSAKRGELAAPHRNFHPFPPWKMFLCSSYVVFIYGGVFLFSIPFEWRSKKKFARSDFIDFLALCRFAFLGNFYGFSRGILLHDDSGAPLASRLFISTNSINFLFSKEIRWRRLAFRQLRLKTLSSSIRNWIVRILIMWFAGRRQHQHLFVWQQQRKYLIIGGMRQKFNFAKFSCLFRPGPGVEVGNLSASANFCCQIIL